MNLECSKNKLQSAVLLAERVTGKNLSLPVLSYIVLEANNRVLKIKSTNLDLGFEISIPVKINKEGSVALNGSLLGNFLSNLNLNEDRVKLDLIDGNLNISSPNHSTKIKSYPTDDFPSIPKPDKPDSLDLKSQDLVEDLKYVWYSASISNLKAEISSVCLYNQPDGLFWVATDSFRLAEKKLTQKNTKTNLPYLIIPLKNIIEIIRILDGLDLDLKVEYNKHQLSLKAENFHLTSRLIDGVFPDYRQIIPTRFTTQITVARNELLPLLKLANVFVDKLNQAELSLNQEGKLEVKTINDNGDNVAWINCEVVEGETLALSLNLKYLLDGLNAINSEKIILGFNGPLKPIVIKGLDDPNFTYLIMPIRR
ncbi:MAG: DNA polymerase III subunit beta [Patescibacteria group bacterium]|mgnify:CR=1 FL=1